MADFKNTLDLLAARIDAALDQGDRRAFHHWTGRWRALKRERLVAASRWAAGAGLSDVEA